MEQSTAMVIILFFAGMSSVDAALRSEVRYPLRHTPFLPPFHHIHQKTPPENHLKYSQKQVWAGLYFAKCMCFFKSATLVSA